MYRTRLFLVLGLLATAGCVVAAHPAAPPAGPTEATPVGGPAEATHTGVTEARPVAGGPAEAHPVGGVGEARPVGAPPGPSPAVPGPAPAAATFSLTIRNQCSHAVKLFIGANPAGGAGATRTIGGGGVETFGGAPTQIWLLDAAGKGMTSFSARGALKMKVLASCNTFAPD